MNASLPAPIPVAARSKNSGDPQPMRVPPTRDVELTDERKPRGRLEAIRGGKDEASQLAPPPRAERATTVKLTFGAPSMIPVVDAMARVARTGATVLLQGESGTGKEVAARLIHETSPRANKPFIVINCAVLTEELLESELFGHERGAFTGAHAQRRGRIELADGGTFFLDEVGELKPALQAKLLRVLEERRFERLGGSTSITVDVRWVAATNRDLRTMTREGKWRDDLYHRLAVFPIRLPPLRERREDIIPLAESLVAELSASTGRVPTARLDDAAKARLARESWPGNVRELRNVLERAMILADGPVIKLEHLWIEASSAATDESAASTQEGSLAELERQTIERTLAAVSGNRRLAAAKLGIGLRTLYVKLKQYEMRRTAAQQRQIPRALG
jgi:two-component system, NtrC family, response regulator AtoC